MRKLGEREPTRIPARTRSMRRQIKVGQRVIPLWIFIVILLSGITSGVMANYIWETITLDFKVEEPLEIVSYPYELNLFPGETKEFNITVKNHASTNLTVVLDFLLGNATYQDNYVTFRENYTVIPGLQELTAWIKVESDAPPINTSLTIYLERVVGSPSSSPPSQFERVESLIFEACLWSDTTYVDIWVRNIGTVSLTMTDVQVDSAAPTAYDFDTGTAGNQTSQSVAPGEQCTIRIWYTYTEGVKYEFAIVTLSGCKYFYVANCHSNT